jgi:hypothetical protein
MSSDLNKKGSTLLLPKTSAGNLLQAVMLLKMPSLNLGQD